MTSQRWYLPIGAAIITALSLGGISIADDRTPEGRDVATAKAATAKTNQGKQGKTGKTGKTGPRGPQGPAGVAGIAGPAGPIGATGTAGATGPAGPKGEPGASAAKGDPGPQGPAGPTGPEGPQGAQGAPCAPTTAGCQGPAGVSGIEVVRTTLNATAGRTTVGEAFCPTGKTAISGGLDTSNVGEDWNNGSHFSKFLVLVNSYPKVSGTKPNGWHVLVSNLGNTQNLTVHTVVVCATVN